jgi:hypothetical protein
MASRQLEERDMPSTGRGPPVMAAQNDGPAPALSPEPDDNGSSVHLLGLHGLAQVTNFFFFSDVMKYIFPGTFPTCRTFAGLTHPIPFKG